MKVFFVVLAVLTSLISVETAFADTFVDRCLGDTQILNKSFTCEVKGDDGSSYAELTLERGTQIQVNTTGLFGKIDDRYKVFKIVHVPPRVDLIVQPESVQFQAKDGSTIAVLTIPCHQSQLASLGVAQGGDYLPNQQVAGCALR